MFRWNRRWKRWLIGLLCFVALAATLTSRPAWHLLSVMFSDRDERPELPAGTIDDASRLNATGVAEMHYVDVDHGDPEAQLRQLLDKARRRDLKVAIAGARHSMGGHTIYPGGISLDMLGLDRLELSEDRTILRAGSGALWRDIIPYLDRHGLSVAVMQSNNSFSVGGSVSVNCHGWQHGRPPIASTVESFRLMKADGSIVRCSRDENAELFSLVLGGYGLFGIILDVDLRVVPNRSYRLHQEVVQLHESLAAYDRAMAGEGVEMVYARMNVTPDNLFDEVILNVFTRVDGDPPPLEARGLESLRRAIFRGSVGSDYGKQLRWDAETRLQPFLANKIVSRNQLLNEGVEVFENRSADTTDILHEYFVPRETVAPFIGKVRGLLREHQADLLNVTVRDVREDRDTFLRYADRPMMAFVMLFSQKRTEEGERRMKALSHALIEASLSAGGRYYLPYRLHAEQEQFEAAYPQAAGFFALKDKYDPDRIFQNRFFQTYGPRAATE